ncbi:MAG: PadR family transcriptional regulator [Promethearchaeota archaeon]
MFFGKRFMGHGMSEHLSGLDVLVLSIIKNNPKISGYDISQKINEKFKGMYKASAGTIYPLLNRLMEKKYLQAEEILEHNRQKKIYVVTEEGIERLKEVLEGNLRHSIDTLGDFVKTVIKAFPVRVNFDDCFCGWPSQDMTEEIEIDEEMYTLENIEKVKRILERLEVAKKRHQRRVKRITKQIEKYNQILGNLEEGRKKAKPIEIVDDDEEFDNF